MLLVLGLVAGLLAYQIGKWRHGCVFWVVNNPANLPLGWHRPEIRYGSLLLVTVLSLVFATCGASVVTTHLGRWAGMLAWGVLLALRWQVSGVVAYLQGRAQLAEIEKRLLQDIPPKA